MSSSLYERDTRKILEELQKIGISPERCNIEIVRTQTVTVVNVTPIPKPAAPTVNIKISQDPRVCRNNKKMEEEPYYGKVEI